MKNLVEYILFLILALIVRVLGLNLSRRASVVIAFIFFYVIPIRKQVTLNNLRRAFPYLSKKEIRKIAFGSYRSFTITLVEILFLPAMKSERMLNSIFIDTEEMKIVSKIHNENKGLIVLSGHFGNWEYLALAGSLKNNIPFNVVVKPQRNHYVDNFLNRCRTRWINKIIPLGTSIRRVYSELMNNNIVAMVADQRGPVNGIRVNFFNIPTAIYTGPALLAIKTNVPIVFGLAIRQADYSYKAHLVEISLDNLPEGEEQQIKELSQRHMSFLESFIKKYPEQWLWMHNIWKY